MTSSDQRAMGSREPQGDSAAWASHGISAITLFVDDLAASKRFYAHVFELPVHFEDESSAVLDFGNALINLLKREAAGELVAPADVAAAGSGTAMQLTLEVDDVDAIAARLISRGVQLLNGPMDRPWGIRTASFRDPSGHIWEIAR